MSEGEHGIFILLVISVVVALFGHALIRGFFLSFLVACTVSALVTAFLFQVVAYLWVGYVDKFVLIAVIVSTAIAFVIAAAVGGLIRRFQDVEAR